MTPDHEAACDRALALGADFLTAGLLSHAMKAHDRGEAEGDYFVGLEVDAGNARELLRTWNERADHLRQVAWPRAWGGRLDNIAHDIERQTRIALDHNLSQREAALLGLLALNAESGFSEAEGYAGIARLAVNAAKIAEYALDARRWLKEHNLWPWQGDGPHGA